VGKNSTSDAISEPLPKPVPCSRPGRDLGVAGPKKDSSCQTTEVIESGREGGGNANQQWTNPKWKRRRENQTKIQENFGVRSLPLGQRLVEEWWKDLWDVVKHRGSLSDGLVLGKGGV